MDNKKIKYVDLKGLRYFAEELKTSLKEHVFESSVFKGIENKISNIPFEKGSADNSAVLKGGNNKATFPTAFAQGMGCEALSSQAHAEGFKTKANGTNSHTEGYKTITTNESEHAQGRCNKSNLGTLHSVGIGESENARKNAHEITKDGNHYIIGIGGYDGTNPTDSEDLATAIKNLINITYEELVNLRNTSKLTSGRFYRITDYVTTTIQANTQSAGHQFDVIVLALSESELSEQAWACRHEFDLEKYKDAYSVSWGESMLYRGIYEYEGKSCHLYESESKDLQMLMDFNNSNVLDGEYADNDYPYICFPSYSRSYEGSWSEWLTGRDYGDDIGFKYNLAEDTYFFGSSLNAWQIWYCLDNDTERFAWAVKYDAMKVSNEDTTYIYRRYKETDNDRFAWVYVNETADLDFASVPDWDDIDTSDIIYTNSDLPMLGEVVSPSVGGTFEIKAYKQGGKGVIYRMIDEWNNDCPYDFKNIQFNRGVYDGGGLAPEGDEDMTFYLFTFSFRTENNEIIDASIFGNNGRLLNDEGQISGVYGNIIRQYITYDGSIEHPTKICQWLNNIVFYSYYDYEGDMYYGCYANLFGVDCYNNSFGNFCFYNSFETGCYGNSFSNDCRHNNFGAGCSLNQFGTGCEDNSFGDNCTNNSFGDGFVSNSIGTECRNNEFRNNCIRNSFDTSCIANILGDNFSYNIIGFACSENEFGMSCSHNILGASCIGNSFGMNNSYNSFGPNCQYNGLVKNCSGNSFGANCTANYLGVDNQNNSFDINCSNNSFVAYCRYNKIDEGVSQCEFDNDQTSSVNQQVQYYHITRGLTSETIAVERNRQYETTVAKDSSGTVKQFCIADIII